FMNNIDYLSLSGRSLRTFLTVLEENSVSAAANRLGTTQSAVSHTLDKLRAVLGDPLFVRSGRGIMPTDTARELQIPIQSVLDDLKSLTDKRLFDPTNDSMEFIIAANDFQRELIFPSIMRKMQHSKIDCQLGFLPAGVPAASLLREARCQLVISPFPPAGQDIYQQDLFSDQLACFYDGKMRKPPVSVEEFLSCDYIDVFFPDYTSSLVALTAVDTTQLKKPKVTIPNFGDIAAFLKGTTLVSVESSLMRLGPLNGFDWAPLPFENETLTMRMAWHQRDHTDPAHQWLRQEIMKVAKSIRHGNF
ncbi:MAG: LysR family transcriptional regulator, partial [Pseudomonadota bacterium]